MSTDSEAVSPPTGGGPAPTGAPVVEVGLLLAHAVDDWLLGIIEAARRRVQSELATALPEFTWRMPLVRRVTPPSSRVVATTQLLADGVEEREYRHWDFVVVVTTADLVSHYRSHAMGAPSRTIGAAVVSTARLFPESGTAAAEDEIVAGRLSALILHLFGDLNSVAHSDDADCYMFRPQLAGDLDSMCRFGAGERQALRDTLADVADARLEERAGGVELGALMFYIAAVRLGWREIAAGVVEARPWEFPLRLGKLTTAAVGATIVLLFSAEVWELGLRQSGGVVTVMALSAMAVATILILARQKLLIRGAQRRTERAAIMNFTLVTVVALGVVVTFSLLLGFAAVTIVGLFDDSLVASWAPSHEGPASGIGIAGFVASLGIVIGGLGATFEGNDYFRHVAYVDEEV